MGYTDNGNLKGEDSERVVSKVGYTDNGNLKGEDSERVVSNVGYTDNGNLKGEDSERVVSKAGWFLIKGGLPFGVPLHLQQQQKRVCSTEYRSINEIN